jgi:glycosyltransferase involved in cell wall biosynthesis
MNFLFTYVALHTGGIETLILRMSDWLVKNNHKVDILLIHKKGEVLYKINKKVNVYSLGSFPEFIFYRKFIKNKIKNDYDVIYSFSPLTTWMSLILRARSNNNTTVLNGVYHLYDYKVCANLYQRKVFDQKLPDCCKIFMTPAVKKEHEVIFKRKFENSIIWPLPILISTFDKINRDPNKFKIVSVGRLATFKTYNIYMLDIVKQLLEANYNVQYYIYGTGDMQKKIAERIASLGLANHVFLMGTIEYEQMVSVLTDAYAFIGMGTSVIEAGLCRVPSIVAIAYSKNAVTHGYIHELPDFNCGELIDKYPQFDLFQHFKFLFDLNEDDYLKICNMSQEVLKNQYDIDNLMDRWIIEIKSIKKNNIEYQKIDMPYFFILKMSLQNIVNLVKHYLAKQLILWDAFLSQIANKHSFLFYLPLFSPVFIAKTFIRFNIKWKKANK